MANSDRNTILNLSITELATALRQGKYKAVEVLQVYRERAEVIHEACNAVVCWNPDAEAEAMKADEHFQRTGQVLGPLHGIPCTVKDHVGMKGLPRGMNMMTSKKYRDRGMVAKRDEPLVSALRSLGAIIFAKTLMTQNGDAWGGGGPADGDCLNPWDTLRSPAGSSSGEGAIVGGGASAFGIGSDIGGSLRLPSSNCGICTLKPTCSRLTEAQTPAGEVSIPATDGVMAKTVEDVITVYSELFSEVLWDAECGTTYVDFYNLRMPRIPFNHAVLNSQRPLNVGYFVDEYSYPMPCATARRAVEEAVEALKGRGHKVFQFRPFSEGVVDMVDINAVDAGFFLAREPLAFWSDHSAAEPLAWKPPAWADPDEPVHPDLEGWKMPSPPGTEDKNRDAAYAALELAAKQGEGSSKNYTGLLGRRDAIRNRFYRAWKKAGLDVLICPTVPFPAVRVEDARYVLRANASCRLFNFLDMPAGHVTTTQVTVQDLAQGYNSKCPDQALDQAVHNCLQDAEGLPMGVQVVALPWQEELCLRGMREVSKACPFDVVHSRLAPVPRRCPTLGSRPELVSVPSVPKSRL